MAEFYDQLAPFYHLIFEIGTQASPAKGDQHSLWKRDRV